MVSEFDPLEYETKYEYNAYGRIKKRIDPNTQQLTFDDIETQSLGSSSLKPSQIGSEGYSNKMGNSSSNVETSVDVNGYISSVKDAMGRTTKIQRDINGNVVKIIHPDLTEKTFKYDSVTFDMIESFDVQNNIKRTKVQNQYGQLISFTDGFGREYNKEYNSVSGLLVKEISPVAGVETSYQYNSKGQVILKTQKDGAKSYSTTYNYDPKGNLTEVVSPGGKSTVNEFDSAGNLIKSTSKISGTTVASQVYAYDSMNRLTQVTSSKNEVTKYNYFPGGKLHTITDPKNKVSTFEYDSMGQIIRKEASTGEVFTYSYDPNGMWMQEIDPNGNIKKYHYNSHKKIVKIELPDDLIQFDYDDRDGLKSASNKNSMITYTKDSMGRLINDSFAGQGEFANITPLNIEYQYDSNSNKTKAILNGSMVYSYSYDSLNRLTEISTSFGQIFNYQYDMLDRFSKITSPGGETNFSYNVDGLVTQIQHKSSNNLVRDQFQYDYDLRNFITQKRTLAYSEDYTHDSNGQLTALQRSNQEYESFSYDSTGNRTSDNEGSYTYNTASERLTDDYRFTYLYDNNGNLIAKNPKNTSEKAYRYEYTSTNQLKLVTILANPFGSMIQQIRFDYDVHGRRLRKSTIDVAQPSNNSYTIFNYDGQNIVLESKFLASSGMYGAVAAYTHSPIVDDVLGVSISSLGVTNKKAKQSGNFYFMKDIQGSVTGITDSSGVVKQRYRYSSFGKVIKIDDDSGNSIISDRFIDNQFAYTGREYDTEISMYYYRARYFDPTIGRFLQQDPDPGKVEKPISFVNKYIYADNSPIMMRDPSGRSSIWGWVMAAMAPITSLILMNTTNFFQSNFDFTAGDIKAVNFAAVTAAIIGLSIITGGAAGSAFGGGLLGVFAGATVGAITGAVIGSVGFPALGLGDSQEGARYGAVVGGIAGAAASPMVQNYFYGQWRLASADPMHYFFDLGYDKDPLFGLPNLLLGGGFSGPSLGGTLVYSGIILIADRPK